MFGRAMQSCVSIIAGYLIYKVVAQIDYTKLDQGWKWKIVLVPSPHSKDKEVRVVPKVT